GETVSKIRVWLDPAVSGLEISHDDVTYVSPTTEANALELGDLAPSGTATLYLRRTIAAEAEADPKVLNHLRHSFYGPW
ncbi:MAG TPA: hypothetical protein VM487_14825, partial [Phycisphaerae bacterium]|nr:hypothetical protein [Phycisphaerae bacterium]